MIDKKLTLAVAITLLVESASVLMWTGAASQRLKEVEVRVAQQADVPERLARVEVQLQLQTAQLDRIEKSVR